MNDFGLLLSRLAFGGGIAAHGAQKAFGSFNGPGPAGAAGSLASLGFLPGERYASAAAWTELVGGTLIVLGLGGPAGPAGLVSTMVVAQTAVHAKNGFFAQQNGVELGVMYAAGAVALASAGYGRLSLDELLGWENPSAAWTSALALGAAVAAGWIVLSQRRPPQDGPNGEADAADGREHLAAALEDRPVPADLLGAAPDNGAPQTS